MTAPTRTTTEWQLEPAAPIPPLVVAFDALAAVGRLVTQSEGAQQPNQPPANGNGQKGGPGKKGRITGDNRA